MPGRTAWAALGAAAAAAAVWAGASAAAAVTAKTTRFTGAITSATGKYAHLRGAVRLVLRSSPTSPPPPGRIGADYTFTLTLSAPSCSAQAFASPRRCVRLTGTVNGTAHGTAGIPDAGTSFTVGGKGSVAPLRKVTATATTHGLGFIASGRYPLTLRLKNAGGSVTIMAQSRLEKGFTSPIG